MRLLVVALVGLVGTDAGVRLLCWWWALVLESGAAVDGRAGGSGAVQSGAVQAGWRGACRCRPGCGGWGGEAGRGSATQGREC